MQFLAPIHRFGWIRDGEIPGCFVPHQLKVIVCQGPTCSITGSNELIQWCEDLAEAGLPIEHEISGCTGNCLESPVVQWNERYLTETTPERLTEQLVKDDIL